MIGRTLDGRYTIERRIGEGGMGAVFVANDRRLGRTVAVKLLASGVDPVVRERFAREAQALARFNHPNINSIYDTGEQNNQPYLVLEYVDGQPLSQVARGSCSLVLELAAQALRALAYAHAHGIVHRDIKPANMLVVRDVDGSRTPWRLKVLDFGVAALSTDPRITGESGVTGTPTYIAPEQANGQPIDGRSDLYSLGVVLYELLAGAVPFTGDTPLATVYQHVHTPPRPLRELRPGLPYAVERFVLTLLAKEPGQRYPSADAALAVLEEIRADPAVAQNAAAWQPTVPLAVRQAASAERSSDGREGELAALQRSLGPGQESPPAVFQQIASLCRDLGRYPEAEKAYDRAIHAWNIAGDARGVAHAMADRAACAVARHDPAMIENWARLAVASAWEIGDDTLIARSRTYTTFGRCLAGDWRWATVALTSLDLSDQEAPCGDAWVAYHYANALAAKQAGNALATLWHIVTARRRMRRDGNHDLAARLCLEWSRALIAVGASHEAIDAVLSEIDSGGRLTSDDRALLSLGLAEAHLCGGEWTKAEQFSTVAWQTGGTEDVRAGAALALARATWAQARRAEAVLNLHRAALEAAQLGDRWHGTSALYQGIADSWIDAGDYLQAESSLRRAERLAALHEQHLVRALCNRTEARLHAIRGEHGRAAEQSETARALFLTLGAVAHIGEPRHLPSSSAAFATHLPETGCRDGRDTHGQTIARSETFISVRLPVVPDDDAHAMALAAGYREGLLALDAEDRPSAERALEAVTQLPAPSIGPFAAWCRRCLAEVLLEPPAHRQQEAEWLLRDARRALTEVPVDASAA